jgi:DNA polymerase I-like protein with 3'-5' exonuclease and polymerase domains
MLRDPGIRKVFHNGFYDAYQVLTRNGVRTRGYTDDTQVGWHCAWPEVAGQSNKGGKRTQKSLSFLNSVFGYEPWWKDYDFATPEEMYQLNGKDCCVTYEIHEAVQGELARLNVLPIYKHEMRLVWPCVEIQSRGFRLDVELIRERERKLVEKQEALEAKLRTLLVSVLESRREALERPGLMWARKTCKCCGGGAKKREACWSCAGFDKAPSKAQLIEHIKHGAYHACLNCGNYQTIPLWKGGFCGICASWDNFKVSKAKAEELALSPCKACDGKGSAEHFNLNLNSSAQWCDVLYNVLKLPKRYNKKKLTVDEEALKAIRGLL